MVGARFFANYAGVADYAVVTVGVEEWYVGDIATFAAPYLKEICGRTGSGWRPLPVFSANFPPEDAELLDVLFDLFPDLSVDGGYGCLRVDRFMNMERALRFVDAVGAVMPPAGEPTPPLV
jgi:hypothetical protein